ncbi:hypothetical protein M5K25_005231 [Dendrobium thyrsiflorum]|uniref:Uncharacterized protein n=1 Tax=Dendrobium thyrsiflorum TaxID=117978 RepID=A0ABD0VPD4_DENTH
MKCFQIQEIPKANNQANVQSLKKGTFGKRWTRNCRRCMDEELGRQMRALIAPISSKWGFYGRNHRTLAPIK